MCFNCRRGERVRQFDLFGAPVGVTFQGQYKHKTGLGGTITILFFLFFGGEALLSLIDVTLNASFSADESTSHT